MKRALILLLAAGIPAAAHAQSDIEFLGPYPYRSIEDSPFATGLSGDQYFVYYDFEAESEKPDGWKIAPGQLVCETFYVDSVDGDDGSIDGYGREGCSWYVNAQTVTISFSVMGRRLPSHVGFVWTDIGGAKPDDGYGEIEVGVFDYAGELIANNRFPGTVGDGQRTGETDEDRFFGVISPNGGIGAIAVRVIESSDWEIDHIQWAFVCRADCNDDKKLDINDYICFQAIWRGKGAYADYNGDGRWTVNDFIAYQADFRRGC